MVTVDLHTGRIVEGYDMRHQDTAVLYGDTYEIWHDYLWPDDED